MVKCGIVEWEGGGGVVCCYIHTNVKIKPRSLLWHCNLSNSIAKHTQIGGVVNRSHTHLLEIGLKKTNSRESPLLVSLITNMMNEELSDIILGTVDM